MKTSIKFTTYKDKIILLPLDEYSWQKANKILNIKLGFLKWAITISFNF